MPSERIQRRIEALLDQADQAVDQLDWAAVLDRAQAVLRLDPENSDALVFLAGAERPNPPAAGGRQQAAEDGGGWLWERRRLACRGRRGVGNGGREDGGQLRYVP